MTFVRSLAKLGRRQNEFQPEWVVVGLGNPGAQYAKTRHNVGFMCTNRLAHNLGARFRSSDKDRSDVAHAVLAEDAILLVQPRTYMNESGQAMKRILRRYDLLPDKLILIYDDVDLPFGTVRVRQEGSSGGHRGIQSIIDSLQTTEIPRVRVGIGRGSGPTKEYVLAEFSPEEREQLPSLCDRVAKIVAAVIAGGVVAAMNQFNGPGVSRQSSDVSRK